MAEEETEKEVTEKGGSKKLLIIIVVVVVLLLGGGAYFFLMGGEEPAEVEESEPEEKYATFSLKPFIVNLSRSTSFLKVIVVIEYDTGVRDRLLGLTSEDKGAEAELADGELPPLFDTREPMIKDAVIRVLSAKQADEVLSEDGKEELKEELIGVINEATGVDDEVVVNVYFEEFIIQ